MIARCAIVIVMSVLVRRMAADRKLRPRVLNDLIDVLFALTSLAFFSQLTARGRSAQTACDLIQGLATDAVRRAMKEQIPVSRAKSFAQDVREQLLSVAR